MAVQYYNGEWTYHPTIKLGISSLSATRDLIEQSIQTQLLSLKHNVSIRGGCIAERLIWDDRKKQVQGAALLASTSCIGCYRRSYGMGMVAGFGKPTVVI